MRRAARTPIFYGLAVLFGLFVVFLYGPIATIVVLSFQGKDGGLVFPMNGVSLHWFGELFRPQSIGDIWGAFDRSIALGAIVMVSTVLFSFLAGIAFRRRFPGATLLFYVAVASLVMPSVVVSLGIGSMFELLGIERVWYGSALGEAFQIADDLLDLEGDPATVGKATGKDAAAHKATLVGVLGPAAARRRLDSLVAEAQGDADVLKAAARFVATRSA